MPLDPTQESYLENWLKKRSAPVGMKKLKPQSTDRKGQNPKWNDDAWFEKRYGDPNYYKRIRGVS